jgi:hypothetical protein
VQAAQLGVFIDVAPGSQGPLLAPSPLRTARESFDLKPLKPFKRPVKDAA